MHHFKSGMTLTLLLVLGCDAKTEPRSDLDSAGSTDVDPSASTGVGPESSGSSGFAESTAGTQAPTTGPAEEEPCSAGDTEGPVETSAYPGHTGDTEDLVVTTNPTTPDETTASPATEGSTSYPDSGETETDGPSEPETGVCGWGAGGDEAGSMCLLMIDPCGGLPKLEMKCDTVSCGCLEGGVQIGSCDVDAVCDDFGSILDKGPSCCGFPAVSP